MPTNPEVDLKGLDSLQPPPMPDLDANVQSAQSEFEQARQSADVALEDMPQTPTTDQFTQPEPQRNIGQLMQMSPWLIALSVFGGARTKLSANNMLGAINGMVSGINQGDESGYTQAYKKWKDQHDQFADMQNQKWQVYREMVKAYKDRVDGKERALQVAESAVRDARKDRATAVQSWQQSVRAALALKDEARKWAVIEESIRSHKANEENTRDRNKGVTDRAAAKGGEKAKAHADALQKANTQIDELIAMVKKSKGKVLGVTGAGGMVRRGVETAGNITGASNDTSAHDFQSKMNTLQLVVAPVLASSNRTAKDQREKIDGIVRGLKPGDTAQNTISALTQLKETLNQTKPDDEPAGKKIVARGTYNNQPVVQYDDGSIDYAPQPQH